MATALTQPNMSCVFQALLTKTVADGGVITDNTKLSSGNQPSDATIFYHDRLTVTNGSNQSLDLYGTLTDQLGNTITFAKVYGFLVVNRSTTSGDVLHVGNSNFAAYLGSATDYVIVGPGGFFMLNNPLFGYTVTTSTADIFKIANPGANNISIDIGIIGK